MTEKNQRTEFELTRFGKLLIRLRRQAGFASQDAVVSHVKNELGLDARFFSKSMLSLYERGQVKSTRPEVLKLLASLYKTSYEELAKSWFEERYDIKGLTPGSQAEEQKLYAPDRNVETCLISLGKLDQLQRALPKGSQVGVCAVSFIDDELFFNLLIYNLKRKIQYHYLLPENTRISYDACLAKLINYEPSLGGKLAGKLCHFTSRPNLDLPVSYVVHITPKGSVQGFIALPVRADRPYYYQVADTKLSLRLLDSFRWTKMLSQDAELKHRLALLGLEAEKAKTKGDYKNFLLQ